MNVCLLNMPIEFYSPVTGGAIATVIMQTARALESWGHRVSVVTPVDGETYQVGEVIPVSVRKRDDLSFLQRRWAALRAKLNGWDWPYYHHYLAAFTKTLASLAPKPDVVIIFNDLVSSKYVKRLLPGTRVIVWLHNEWRTRHDVAETARSTDVFLTCSHYIKDWTQQEHPLFASKLVVALNGVDLDAFHPRTDYLKPTPTVRVLVIGRIDPNKGPDIAADAVAVLRAQNLPVTLTVAGGLWFYGKSDPSNDPFFRVLEPKMRAANAEYLGHVARPEVPELVREHDVVMVLSRSQEPFGLVVLEAMASGCAVVASNRGGLPEACGEAGLLVDPDNFEAVTDALRRLVTDREFLREQKEKSVRRAARASWSECAAVVEQAAAGRAVAEALA